MNNTVEFEGFKTRILTNIPILEARLPEPVIQYLWGLIKIAEDNPENLKDGLAGNISKSSKLVDTQKLFNKFCIPTLQEVDNTMGKSWHTLNSGKSFRYDLTHLWVNYQRQTEFNPQHDHGGAYSFVVWMKIPTSNKEQRELPIAKESLNGDSISNFSFSYTDILGNIRNAAWIMEKETAGTMVMFPSRLKHQVYPFYECDEERISIAGNFGVKYDNT